MFFTANDSTFQTHVATDLPLNIDVDSVLRGQGADPAVVRQRRPRLVSAAERAVELGNSLITPVAAYCTLDVDTVRHERLTLAGGHQLTGGPLARHLAPAQQITLIVYTIGPALEQRVSEMMSSDPMLGLALDGFGSAAVEILGETLCAHLEAEARPAGRYASVPLSPGIIGWPVDVGQPQIFSVVDADAIGITLNDASMMVPHKSASMILGLSAQPFEAGRTCDFCALRDTCRYQDHYAHSGG
ncbi:MAG: hypothetical protein U0559_06340 [Anaerolineae bacterium]